MGLEYSLIWNFFNCISWKSLKSKIIQYIYYIRSLKKRFAFSACWILERFFIIGAILSSSTKFEPSIFEHKSVKTVRNCLKMLELPISSTGQKALNYMVIIKLLIVSFLEVYII